ncbi:unnamed protein product, partial [Ascophyllum nodosum]
RRAEISRQTRFFYEDEGAALLVTRCSGQERDHHIHTKVAETLMVLVRVLPCVSTEQLHRLKLVNFRACHAHTSALSLNCRYGARGLEVATNKYQ